jgi:hypothetical protein
MTEPLGRFVDDFAQTVLVRRDLAGPAGDVARLVIAGVEAGRVGDIEGLLGVIPQLIVSMPGTRVNDESGFLPALEGLLAAKVATVATLMVAVELRLRDEDEAKDAGGAE